MTKLDAPGVGPSDAGGVAVEGMMFKRWTRFKMWMAVKALPFVARNAPEAVNGYIQDRAAEMAVKVTMAHLAREGMLSCSMCPTRAPLLKIGGAYSCRRHAAEVAKKQGVVVGAAR